MADKGYTISMQPETTISADGFITGEQAIGITSTPSHNRYLQWAVRDLTLEGGDHVYGTLGANVKISIADDATATVTVTLDGVNINAEGTWNSGNYAGITCLGDATIILEGTNTVKGFYNEYPGIHIAANKTLTIQGSGSLTASSNGYAAGIGGGVRKKHCGNIIISGGTVTATGGAGSAGIGGGKDSNCGNITISGGTVIATGGNYGAGIGGGQRQQSNNTADCGNITISGGTVEATGGYNAAGIGGGKGIDGSNKTTCGKITITSGVTSVTATKGSSADYSIGAGRYGNCGTVTIGGVVGAIKNSPYTYPQQ